MQSALPRRLSLFLSVVLAGATAQAQPENQPSPANVASTIKLAVFDGLWCGTGLLHEFSLRLKQQERDVQGTLMRRDRAREIEGHVDGAVLRTQNTKIGSLVLERAGDILRITGGDGPLSLVTGARFQRASSGACAG